MNTLAAIETAAVLLPPDQQQELFLFLAEQVAPYRANAGPARLQAGTDRKPE
jgi:hypothetical protein